MASSSPQIIFGALIQSPGRYELCWVTTSEVGEVSATTRKVVVDQHGPYFWLKFADESFQAYPCEHEGLRCDLLDPSVAWFRPVALELSESDTIRPGDTCGKHPLAQSFWGRTVANLRLYATDKKIKVYRPIQPSGDAQSSDGNDSTARMRGAVEQPGLQAAG